MKRGRAFPWVDRSLWRAVVFSFAMAAGLLTAALIFLGVAVLLLILAHDGSKWWLAACFGWVALGLMILISFADRRDER